MTQTQDVTLPPCDGNEKTAPPVVRSEFLLSDGRELRILHGQQTYRLMLTRNNKLILQK